MRHSGDSLKKSVNHFLRIGLMPSEERRKKPFTVSPRPLRLPTGLRYDSIAGLLEDLEGPAPLVIILDATILLYACDSSSNFHAQPLSWVEHVFSGWRSRT